MRKKITAIILSASCLLSSAMGQQLPQVIPPSPNAASLFKFVEYPVDFSTGLPQVSIPIFEIKSGDLSLPITMNYHSSGRKVYDETGPIGLGWSLMAGGMISRIVHGDADDNDYVIQYPVPWKKQADINQQTQIDFLATIDNHPLTNQPWRDTEYDIFSFSINSLSGKFIFRDDNNVKTPVLISKKPYAIQWHKATMQSNINYFDYITIIDDKGITYRFGKSLIDSTEYREIYSSEGTSYAPTSSWMLTEMISANKVDTISFKYTGYNNRSRTISQTITVYDDWIDPSNVGGDTDPDFPPSTNEWTENYNNSNYFIQRLTEIKYRQGKIIFNLNDDPGYIQPLYKNKLINNIQVFDAGNNLTRTISFTRSELDRPTDGNAATKKLDSVLFKGKDGISYEQYDFEYYPGVYFDTQKSVDARYCDLWGYYNASGQMNMCPLITNLPYIDFSGNSYIGIGNSNAMRNPDLAATKSGVLKKITYPTGGSTEFVYELNRYLPATGTQVKNCGGLRLAELKSNDLNGNIIRKLYTYGINESGYGNLPLDPNVDNMFYQTYFIKYVSSNVTSIDLKYRQRYYSADVLPAFSYIAQKPIIYTEVSEYYGEGLGMTGKTVYKFDYDDNIAPTSIQSFFQQRDYKYWKTSALIEKTDYKQTASTAALGFSPVKRTASIYTETQYEPEKLYGLHIKKDYLTTPDMVIDAPNGTGIQVPSYRFAATRDNYLSQGPPLGPLPVYSFGDYSISIGKKELTQTTETLFNDNGQIVTTTNYTYNSNHLPASETTTDSKGDNITKEYKYPFDALGVTVNQQMVARNMLSYPVEQTQKENAQVVNRVITNYRDWGGNVVAPETVQTQSLANPVQTRIRFHAYDNKGNTVTVSKENDVQKSYIWGYNNIYPVAEVTGISYANAIGVLNQAIIQNPSSDQALRDELNKIRINFPSAFVVTYTYAPLVGVTSQTDINGKSNYYEYDSYGRLKLIRDMNGNIIRTFKYQYRGTTPN